MMDPLSISASAAGLISLGLQVSSGIIGYCKVYRSREADLVQLVQHARELDSFLGLIRDRTMASQTPNTDIDSLLQGCRTVCDACLGDIKQLNAKYTSLKPVHGFNGRRKGFIQSLKYSFDKGKLDDLRSQLQGFNAKLQGYLQLINLDATRDIRNLAISESTKVTLAMESSERAIQSCLSNVEQVVTTRLDDGVGRLESSLQHGLKKAERNLTTALGGNLSAISDQISLSGTARDSQSLGLMQHIDQRFEHYEKLLLRMLAPSHSVDDQAASLKSDIGDDSLVRQGVTGKANLTMPVQNVFDFLCICPRTRQRRSAKQHQEGCIYYSGNRKKRTISMSLRAFRRQITAICIVEYSHMAWARDWQVRPNLTLRATVPDDSPLFMAIKKVGLGLKSVSTVQELEESFRGCLIKLKQIFANGEGWPTDVDTAGDNLLHCVLLNIFNPLLYTMYDERVVVFMQFIAALKQIGVPMDGSGSGITPFDWFLSCMGALARKLPSTPSTFLIHTFLECLETEPTISLDPVATLVSILRLKDPAVYDLLDCSELIYAILHQSEPDITRLLMSNASLIHERDRHGHTPLHFAVNWPRGLSLLIEHGGESIRSIINCESYNRDSFTALQYAIAIEEEDSVKLLLSAGASIMPDVFRHISNYGRKRYRQVTDVVIESLARQRRDLLQLALQHLPTEDIVELELQEGKLLDDEAITVVDALRRQNVPISPAYDFIKPGSVYHWAHVDHYTAQKLYETGFRKIEARWYGYTPLPTLRGRRWDFEGWLKLVSWFKGQGADLHAPVPLPDKHRTSEPETTSKVDPPWSTSTVHFLMVNLSLLVRERTCTRIESLPRLVSYADTFASDGAIAASLFGDRTTDSCICTCTISGCTPASKYLQSIITDQTYCENVSDAYTYVLDAIQLAEPVIPDSVKDGVSLEYIRLITFTRLGMKHTCCRIEERHRISLDLDDDLVHLLDPTEIDEIREEDQYLAERLEILVKEFEGKFRELNVPLTQFVEQFLWPRLDEIEEERDELTEEELRALRETGVVLYEH
ncbi:hypothetical protein F5Y06DRAFT_308245 [Hypoxylon sp. FL0890]|nr:hypothetical protein F5Y06DRAFT_308245 [Hypoxylon sp. FL0890]